MQFWISPKLTDGLGNRFFQLAAAIKASDDSGRELCILLPRYTKLGHGNFDLLFHMCPDVPVKETENSWIEVEESLNLPETEKGIVLKGYFQDLKFFPVYNHPLLPKLPTSINITDRVAVHFRFGDYCILNHHKVPLEYYYMKALEKFPKETSFVLISDSPEKLPAIQEELLQKGYTVSLGSGKTILETFQEIASCSRGCIGSNSTFSWWAAFLSWKALRFPETYKAYFPDTWSLQQNTKPNLFTLPFTESITIEKENREAKLESFRYN